MLFKKIVFLGALIPMLAVAQNPYLDYNAAIMQGMIMRQIQERDMSPEQFRIEPEINRILAHYHGVIIPVNRENLGVIARQVNTNDYEFVARVINNHNKIQQTIHNAEALLDPRSVMNQTISGTSPLSQSDDQVARNLEKLNRETAQFLNQSDRMLENWGYHQ